MTFCEVINFDSMELFARLSQEGLSVIAMRRVAQPLLLTLISGVFLLSGLSPAYALESIALTDEQDKYQIGRHMEYLEDPIGQLTIADVTSADHETQFIPSETDIPTIGFTDSAYWVRVRLRNESHAHTDWRFVVQQSSLDFIDLYLPDGKGNFHVKQAGDMRPFTDREVEFRLAVFKVFCHLEQIEHCTFVFKLQGRWRLISI